MSLWSRSELEQILEELKEWEKGHLIPGAEGAVCTPCRSFEPASGKCWCYGEFDR